jgi:hypothetical protein
MQGQESRTYFVMHPGLKYNKENKWIKNKGKTHWVNYSPRKTVFDII